MDGNRLRALRTNKKLTQEELGKAVHVTKVSISGYENGGRTPDIDTLTKLADYFDVSTDYLLGRTDVPQVAKRVQEVPLHIKAGISDDRYQSLEPLHKKVLNFLLQRRDLAFFNQPEDLLDNLEDYVPIYEKLKDKYKE